MKAHGRRAAGAVTRSRWRRGRADPWREPTGPQELLELDYGVEQEPDGAFELSMTKTRRVYCFLLSGGTELLCAVLLLCLLRFTQGTRQNVLYFFAEFVDNVDDLALQCLRGGGEARL